MNCIERLKRNFYSLGYYCTPNLSIHQNSTQKLTWIFLVTLGETYLYHETNQSYTDGPTLPINNQYCVCTAFTSKSHGYRPVVVYVASGRSTLYLWDYTMNNDWETCKYSHCIPTLLDLHYTV